MARKQKHNADDSLDDYQPIALRRKRRMTTVVAQPEKNTQAGVSKVEMVHDVTTPKKSKKRVRFSDPGPDIMPTSLSTGITPYIKRTVLTPDNEPTSPSSSHLLAKAPRRRASFPLKLVTCSSSAIPTPPPSGEIQFAPLRQVLDDRVKRRLRRNNLSEEINEIDTEKRTNWKRTREIEELKEELALVRQLGCEVTGRTDNETGNTDKIRELEDELRQLKENNRERSITEASSPPNASEGYIPMLSDDILPTCDQDDEEWWTTHGSVEETLQKNDCSTSEVGVQTVTTSTEIASLQCRLDTQASYLVKARLDLEHICPGETTLGLRLENGDAKPVLDALLNQLRSLKTQLLLSETSLSTSQTQESNLRCQFNAVLQQLDRARAYGEDVAAKNRKSIADLVVAESQAKDFKVDVAEKEKTVGKLQNALESYRKEVSDLEGLVTRLEADHEDVINSLRGEMDEAVADLECHVVVETRGRQEAEAECAQRLLRVRELESMESELKVAIGEKQVLIRSLENEMQNLRDGKEFETGLLNVRISELASTSEEIKTTLAKVEAEKLKLIERMKVEREAASRTMERMTDEIKKSLDQVAAIGEAHAKEAQNRGTEVAEHKGLLTPVSAVKFRDAEKIEGYVEVGRGKSRKKRGIDSGIGILEEDEDEGMIDANV